MGPPGMILVVIDAMRPDALSDRTTPNLCRLMDHGAWTLKAQTVFPSLTLPVHFSIFTSVPPSRHGVLNNCDRPQPAGDTVSLLDVLARHGKYSSAFYNWENLRALGKPGSLRYCLFSSPEGDPDSDYRMAASAASFIRRRHPDFCFLYLGTVDLVAHSHGFMSPAYMKQLEKADAAVGYLVRTLSESGLDQRYNLLVQSDHGGRGHDHEASHPEVLTIPWICRGPSIREDCPIEGPVSVLDTAPTICRLMELAQEDPPWEGRPLQQIFEKHKTKTAWTMERAM
ncbi:alkaline phosphatase family protein [Desulfacinum hydrothermale]|nr:ectonucleotide pyrophosphatase/phosphodiesterase [Desulfacinum hydrothermale]